LVRTSRIAIDIMGGDHGPTITVPAALAALCRHQQLETVLVGDREQIEPLLRDAQASQRRRLRVEHTTARIADQDRPESVLREHRNSSMFLAINLVKQGAADACVSAGNTGALILAGRHLLKTVDGIRRPAMVATLPVLASGRNSLLLDVGANVGCDAEQLYQYAVMGAALASVSLPEQTLPRVGLLNVGAEAHKGSEEIRRAAQKLQHTPHLHYVGFVEGHRIFSGDVDVLVCDGFTGNVAIKSTAGLVRTVEQMISHAVEEHPLRARKAAPLLKQIRDIVNPAHYNGAQLLGLKGSVIKSHGNADSEGFAFAIEQALQSAIHAVPQLIAERMASAIRPSN